MKLIIGLGNPGREYERTLHNVGFRVVEDLAKNEPSTWKNFSKSSKTYDLKNLGAILLKPQTFMNESGVSAQEVAGYFKIPTTNIWVVHDDLDLSAGDVRISFESSSAGHRGVQSIIDALGTTAFWRFRIGIGRPPTNIPAESYVLTVPTGELHKQVNLGEKEALSCVEKAFADNEPTVSSRTVKNKNTPA